MIKQCTGCGHLSTDPLGNNANGEPYLACCPDNNYVEVVSGNKERGILIIEPGVIGKDAMLAALAARGHSDVVVMTPEEAKEEASKILKLPTENYVYKLEPAPVPKIYGEKEFICKGKHQYREGASGWVCQCGRKL
jgi:hypothetical protein